MALLASACTGDDSDEPTATDATPEATVAEEPAPVIEEDPERCAELEALIRPPVSGAGG